MSSRAISAKNISDRFRTWIEIDRHAARHNYNVFRKLIGRTKLRTAKSHVKLWSVVKSNAYGHGLVTFVKIMDKFGVDGFCVDSVTEAFRLRDEGIVKPILVLGYTLPVHFKDAAAKDITLTVSSMESLRALPKKNTPNFHLKIDTGMHRQGLYPEDIARVLAVIKSSANLYEHFVGAYTHFSSAKDMTYPGYVEMQYEKFQTALTQIKKAGFKNIMRHAAATGGTLLNEKYHFDAVRIGIGLYGHYPSGELAIQRAKLDLRSVLSWRTIVTEVKPVKKESWIGYDGAERMHADGRIAILPIGYWHGFPRVLSHVGEVLINGKRAKVMGRVSMDILIVDVSTIKISVGDIATVIGIDPKDAKAVITAEEQAQRAGGASYYEVLTRINPLIERIEI
jgi:alanine racemase